MKRKCLSAQTGPVRTIVTLLLMSFCAVPMSSSCGRRAVSPAKHDLRAVIRFAKIEDERRDIVYPVVTGLVGSAVQDSINAMIRQTVFAPVEKLEREYDAGEMAARSALRIWVKSDVMFNHNGILSVMFKISWFAGGAHPMTVQRSITTDINKIKTYKLDDLFENDKAYKVFVNDRIKTDFSKSDIPPLKKFERIGENQEYYLSNDGVVIYFQLYEYLPYYTGFPEFVIPYADLAQHIAKPGPLEGIGGRGRR